MMSIHTRCTKWRRVAAAAAAAGLVLSGNYVAGQEDLKKKEDSEPNGDDLLIKVIGLIRHGNRAPNPFVDQALVIVGILSVLKSES